MQYLNLILLLSVLLFGVDTRAQSNVRTWIIQQGLSTDYPFLHKVVLSCSISYTPADGFYFYDYVLTNDRENKGDIWTLEIDISRPPSSVTYDTSGLRFTDEFEQNLFRRYYPGAANVSVPVGFPALPSLNWTADIEHDTVVSFNVDTLLPAPGSTVSGFTIMSKGLPGIRGFTAHPYFDVYKYLPDVDADTTEALDSIYTAVYNYVNSMTKNMNYCGWTIGPTAPPLDFSASTWIDTLASYKHQCVTLGWLRDDRTCEHECEETMRGRGWYTKEEVGKMRSWEVDDSWDFDRNWNNGIVEVLDKRLEMAKRALMGGDSAIARRDLQIFVMEVDLVNRLGQKQEARSKKSEVRTL